MSTPDTEIWPYTRSVYARADAFLLGRRTYETWAAYWPHHDTQAISGDVEAAVRELKAQPGRERQVNGTGELLRWLLEHDLVDELNLLLYPVVVDVRRDAPDLSTGRPRAFGTGG